MNATMFAYILGTILGVTFAGGAFFTTKKVEPDTIKIEFQSSRKQVFMVILTLLMIGLFYTIFVLMRGKNVDIIQNALGITYWLSMIFVFTYVQSRTMIVTEEGAGYKDIFGRIGKLFFKWDQIDRFELTSDQVTFHIKAGNVLKLKTKYDTTQTKQYQQVIGTLLNQKNPAKQQLKQTKKKKKS